MESEERFRNLYNNAEVGLFRTRISDGVPLQINQRYAEMAGYETIEECLENFVAADHYADPEVRERMVEAITKHGEVKNYQAEIIRKDNKHFWIDFSARAYPEGGYVEGALVDITDKKNAERKLVASLIEKETLLKEIHHRVKNNLQVISSLLDLQSSYLKDEKARDVLHNSMDRISAMARVHTMLYQSEDMSRIDLGGFIGDLAVRLQQSHWITGSPVDIHVDVPDVSLTIETSIPCGLILNELVSNALKHAFPEGKGGGYPYNHEGRGGPIRPHGIRQRDGLSFGCGFPEHEDPGAGAGEPPGGADGRHDRYEGRRRHDMDNYIPRSGQGRVGRWKRRGSWLSRTKGSLPWALRGSLKTWATMWPRRHTPARRPWKNSRRPVPTWC